MVTTGEGMNPSMAYRVPNVVYKAIFEVPTGFIALLNRAVDATTSASLNPLSVP